MLILKGVYTMKKLLIAAAMTALITSPALAEIKIGVILGFTGPLESLAPGMAAGAELAIKEVDESGKLLGGERITSLRGDSTCIDAGSATATAERLITADKVDAIVGADCSGVTTAIVENVLVANGIAMVSPSATSPALSTVKDNGLFFRTAPSDVRQGQIVTDILISRGIKTAAMTYTNNDYGKGLAESIRDSYGKAGGTITINTPHEDGKADYTAEVAALAQAGGDILIVAGYLDQGGKGIIQTSLDSGAFDKFYLPDGMVGDSLPAAIGPDLNGSIGDFPGTDSPGAVTFENMALASGFKSGPFSPESYDAAALILLAMQKAGTTDSQVFKTHIEQIANAPGQKIFPGELGKALDLIKDGVEIDYVGASAVELVNGGESAGNYREIEVQNGENVTVKFR